MGNVGYKGLKVEIWRHQAVWRAIGLSPWQTRDTMQLSSNGQACHMGNIVLTRPA